MKPVETDEARILVVDDETSVLLTIATILEDRGYRVATAPSGRDAIALIEREAFALVLTDLAMKDCDGLEVLAAVQRHQRDTVAIMLTGYASLDSSIEAIRRGAYDYLTKPTNVDEMCQTIARGLEKRRLARELHRRVEELGTLHRLANVGVDAILRSTRDLGQALTGIAEIVSELLAPRGAVMIVRGRSLDVRTVYARTDEARALLTDPSVMAAARVALESGSAAPTIGAHVSVLAVPIAWQEERLGAMVVCDPAPREWSEESVQTASTIASRASLAIANAALYRDVLVEKEKLKRILDAAPEGIIGLDPEGRIAFFSRGAERLIGLREADVRGRAFADLVAPHATVEMPDALRARAASATGGLTSGALLFRGKGAEEIFCDALWAHVGGEAGDSLDAILTIRDARERRRIEEEKTNTLSFVTHELKTPLTTILTFTYLLCELRLGPLNERQAEAVRVLESNAHNLLGMIENMLATARISQGNVPAEIRPLRLGSIAEDVRASFGPVAGQRGINFTIEVDEDVEIDADRGALLMAVNNLLSNAFKFTDRGGRTTLSMRERGTDVLIEVQDSGVGIPEEFRERIFQRYFKMGARAGTGLGLAIVKSAAESHGGRVWVESPPGEGAHFYLLIPKRQLATADVERQPTDATPTARR